MGEQNMYGWVIAKNIDISFLDESNTKQYFVDGYNIFVNVMNVDFTKI